MLLLLMLVAVPVTGRVTVMKDGKPKAEHGNVVVSIEGVADGAPKAGITLSPTITQRELAFVPEINVVTVGSTIAFPNEDKVFHNVFSVSEPAKFDLGLYKSGEKKAVTFTHPGVVDVYCNIHPQMIAKIKVLDTKYFVVTASDGDFKIPDVPAGKYTLVAWQAFGDETRQAITVDGNTQPVAVTLAENAKSKRHLRKDGTPYGRYK